MPPKPKAPVGLEPLDPFPHEIHMAYREHRKEPQYKSRGSVPYSTWLRYHVFLDDNTTKPENSTDSNIKQRALRFYILENRQLYRKRNPKVLSKL
jgi:hypothetical protein